MLLVLTAANTYTSTPTLLLVLHSACVLNLQVLGFGMLLNLGVPD
jgi:hypothetical protein